MLVVQVLIVKWRKRVKSLVAKPSKQKISIAMACFLNQTIDCVDPDDFVVVG